MQTQLLLERILLNPKTDLSRVKEERSNLLRQSWLRMKKLLSPKRKNKSRKEHEQEQLGRGAGGAEGARAAGIAMMPEEGDTGGVVDPAQSQEGPVVGAVSGAGSDTRGVRTVVDRQGEGVILDQQESEVQEVEGVPEGGGEQDEIIEEAERGDFELDEPTHEPTMVPIHPPAEDGPHQGEEEDEEAAAPPPPPRMGGLQMGKDEVELKHEHDAMVASRGQEEDDDEPAPPPPRRMSSDRPLGPRPLPSTPGGVPQSPVRQARRTSIPAPPVGNAMVPPRDEEEDERETDGLGDEDQEEGEDEPAPPPPPRRQPSLPGPLQIGIPTPVGGPNAQAGVPNSPVLTSPSKSSGLRETMC